MMIEANVLTDKPRRRPMMVKYKIDKPVDDWISAPSPNFVDRQTMTHRL